MPKNIKFAAFFVAAVILISTCTTGYRGSVDVYNTSISLKNQYKQKQQEQVSVYDAKFLAFQEKSKIANINRETFVVVTEIIMTNRHDGMNVAWKWTQENQQIPYNEFTSFYRELSGFVSEQYETLSSIEKQKQQLVSTHNSLIQTFPNNLYNWILRIRPIEYSFGYVSDSTLRKFKL
jgi:hypothetical protein